MTKKFVRRYKGNPILTKDDIPYAVETVHNAGVTKFDGRYWLKAKMVSISRLALSLL